MEAVCGCADAYSGGDICIAFNRGTAGGCDARLRCWISSVEAEGFIEDGV